MKHEDERIETDARPGKDRTLPVRSGPEPLQDIQLHEDGKVGHRQEGAFRAEYLGLLHRAQEPSRQTEADARHNPNRELCRIKADDAGLKRALRDSR